MYIAAQKYSILQSVCGIAFVHIDTATIRTHAIKTVTNTYKFSNTNTTHLLPLFVYNPFVSNSFWASVANGRDTQRLIKLKKKKVDSHDQRYVCRSHTCSNTQRESIHTERVVYSHEVQLSDTTRPAHIQQKECFESEAQTELIKTIIIIIIIIVLAACEICSVLFGRFFGIIIQINRTAHN